MPRGDQVYLAYLTGEHEQGKSTAHSPQHLTLVPPFKDRYREQALSSIERVAVEFMPFEIQIGKTALFGQEHDIPVYLVEPAEKLRVVHSRLIEDLMAHFITPGDRRFSGDNYMPHITIKQAHQARKIGDKLLFDHIALMHKTERARTLLAVRQLSGEKDTS